MQETIVRLGLPPKLLGLHLTLWLLAAVAVACNLLIIGSPPLVLQFGAVWTLTILVPGFLTASWLTQSPDQTLHGRLFQTVIAVGIGYAVTILLMLGLSYLPGGLKQWQTLLAFDLLIATLAVAESLRQRRVRSKPLPAEQIPATSTSWHWPMLGIIVMLSVAASLRLPNIGYSEFQDDEVTVLLHAAEVIQGREDALFVHDKGPAEILLTTATYSLLDRINETVARLPFALANLVGLIALYVLGRRLFDPLTAWIAAMFLAIDGYFIGFSRIVQYQSLVFLFVVLFVLCIAHVVLLRRYSSAVDYLTTSALFFSTGILAHYEAIFGIVPVTLLLVHSLRQQASPLRRWRIYVFPALVLLTVVAAFYVPFVLHPRFARTFGEITGNRIGGQFPYNNLADFVTRTTIYSTSYALLLMVLGVLLMVAGILRKSLPVVAARGISAAILTGLLVIAWRPQWLVIGDSDWTWLLFTAIVGLVLVLPRVDIGARAVWAWFGIPLILALFFVQKPRTHVYDFYFAWSLVAGLGLSQVWQALEQRIGKRHAAAVGVPIVTILVLAFANYAFWMFTYTDQEILRTWNRNRPTGYWVPYDTPAQNAIFGFPFKNGWKVVGVLYDQGVLSGPFARNGKRGVANWYTRGGVDCSRDADYYIYTEWNEPTNKGLLEDDPRPSPEAGYRLIHTVTVSGEPRLEIYERNGQPLAPQIHDVADYEDPFLALTDPIFERNGPTARPDIAVPLSYRFGDHVWLTGYRLNRTTVAPGDRLDLTLYWRTDAVLDTSYKVFTQVIEMEEYRKAGQRDGIPGCERYPTDNWLPGDTIADGYSIHIDDAAVPGPYRLLIGFYDENEDRIPLFAQDGTRMADALDLTEIVVQASPAL